MVLVKHLIGEIQEFSISVIKLSVQSSFRPTSCTLVTFKRAVINRISADIDSLTPPSRGARGQRIERTRGAKRRQERRQREEEEEEFVLSSGAGAPPGAVL